MPELMHIPGFEPPHWFCMKGFNMRLITETIELPERVVIAKDANPNTTIARVTIGPDIERVEDFKLMWQMRHFWGDVLGHLLMRRDELAAAFGLKDGSSPEGEAHARRCGLDADAAEQGLFFRKGRYLKLPHPGVSLQGDPNISIYLTDDMRRAVARLTEFASEVATFG